MASEEENLKPDKDSKESASEEMPPLPEAAAEAPLPPATLPPELAPSRKDKKEKKSFGLGGLIFLLALVIAGGAGAGGFYLYQEQTQFQNETLARISELEGQLNALDTEAEQTRKNQQTLEALNQDLQQHKTDISATLKSHQNSLSTLDEDVLRLKEKVAEKTGAPMMPAPMMEGISEVPGMLTVPSPPETRDEDIPDTESQEEGQPDESKEFLDWMENFFSAIWDWFAGLFK